MSVGGKRRSGKPEETSGDAYEAIAPTSGEEQRPKAKNDHELIAAPDGGQLQRPILSPIPTIPHEESSHLD
jgi:hypothetical protein